MTDFYDSTQPAKIPHGLACLYADGDYQAGTADLDGFSGIKWITVLGSQWAQIADFERGNAVYEVPGRLQAWAGGMCHQGVMPIVYCGRANLHQAITALGDTPRLLWIPTLDGVQRTLAGLVAWVADGGVVVDPAHVWACQYAGGVSAAYDTSVLYGEWATATP